MFLTLSFFVYSVNLKNESVGKKLKSIFPSSKFPLPWAVYLFVYLDGGYIISKALLSADIKGSVCHSQIERREIELGELFSPLFHTFTHFINYRC